MPLMCRMPTGAADIHENCQHQDGNVPFVPRTAIPVGDGAVPEQRVRKEEKAQDGPQICLKDALEPRGEKPQDEDRDARGDEAEDEEEDPHKANNILFEDHYAMKSACIGLKYEF